MNVCPNCGASRRVNWYEYQCGTHRIRQHRTPQCYAMEIAKLRDAAQFALDYLDGKHALEGEFRRRMSAAGIESRKGEPMRPSAPLARPDALEVSGQRNGGNR